MRIAIAGNQNSGKTTLFNTLTGGRQHVGNYPGVTVEKKTGFLRGDRHTELLDLPGVYSLTPHSEEERVASDALSELSPDVIINVVDATCIRRGLYLTLSLMERKLPIVIALSMTDIAERRGLHIDMARLGSLLGVSVVRASDTGRLLEAARNATVPCTKPTQPCGHTAHEVTARYRYIDSVADEVLSGERGAECRPKFPDALLTSPILGIPIFCCIIAAVFLITFGVPGRALCDAFAGTAAKLCTYSDALLSSLGTQEWLCALICDGVLSGIASVLGFLPTILILFFLLSLLEDSGYMARVAFLLDAPLSKIGLSGKSAVPLLIGFGCSVPAIMAARAVPGERERKRTALLVPFMSCSAKLPIYAMLTGTFFRERQAIVMIVLYAIGIFCAIIYGMLLKSAAPTASSALIMEMPEYRMPRLENTCALMWEKALGFVKKAFTVILAATVALWILKRFDFLMQPAESDGASMLGKLAGAIAPVFAPLGFGDFRCVAALITGLTAKEAVISTLAVLLGALPQSLGTVFTPASAASFLTFTLLYIPCAAASSALARETGRVRAAASMFFQCGAAWCVSWIVYRIMC